MNIAKFIPSDHVEARPGDLLIARAHRQLSRLDAAIERNRFNARERKLAEKLRANLEYTESEERAVLSANPHLTNLAYFLRDYGAAIDSACWGDEDYFSAPRVSQGMV